MAAAGERQTAGKGRQTAGKGRQTTGKGKSACSPVRYAPLMLMYFEYEF